MEIDEKTLKNIIQRILQEYLLEKKELPKIKKKDVYIILGKQWSEKYNIFFKGNKLNEKYNVFTVFQKNGSSKFETLKNLKEIGTILYDDTVELKALKNYKTIFPVVSQELITKIALCIDDIFETKWIKNCFRKGEEIEMLTSGFEIFTGKEPKKYIEKIKEYYKTVLTYNIKIKSENIGNNEEDIFKDIKNKNPGVNNNRKIITYKDVITSEVNNKIIINKGDIITESAKDLALKLNLEIVNNF